MTIEIMQKLLEADEKITVEYKKCTNELSNSVFETVASFSNRYGGYMILGVEDSGKSLGVNQKAARNIRVHFPQSLLLRKSGFGRKIGTNPYDTEKLNWRTLHLILKTRYCLNFL